MHVASCITLENPVQCGTENITVREGYDNTHLAHVALSADRNLALKLHQQRFPLKCKIQVSVKNSQFMI